MNHKNLYIAVVSCAIALNANPVGAENNSQPNSAENVFVCAMQGETPTMFAYTPGKVNLTPLMSWHSEYLLPGQSGEEICQRTATKLQTSLKQEEAKFIKSYTNKKDKANLVCLVSSEDGSCTGEDSERLFSVNPSYNPGCVLSNKKPIDCMVLNTRGIYSYNEQPYRAMWWPW